MMDYRIKNAWYPIGLDSKKIKILCNDCLNKTEIEYHHIGHKCKTCGSYNTAKIGDIL